MADTLTTALFRVQNTILVGDVMATGQFVTKNYSGY